MICDLQLGAIITLLLSVTHTCGSCLTPLSLSTRPDLGYSHGTLSPFFFFFFFFEKVSQLQIRALFVYSIPLRRAPGLLLHTVMTSPHI